MVVGSVARLAPGVSGRCAPRRQAQQSRGVGGVGHRPADGRAQRHRLAHQIEVAALAVGIGL
jgi:hypothetical protein